MGRAVPSARQQLAAPREVRNKAAGLHAYLPPQLVFTRAETNAATRTVSFRCSIDAMSVATASAARLGLALGGGGPAATQGAPLVYIAAGHGEVGLWDIAAGNCLQVRSVGREDADDITCCLCLYRLVSSGILRKKTTHSQVLRTLTAEEAQSGCADAPAALKPAADSAESQQRRLGSIGSMTLEGTPADGEDLAEGLKSGLCISEVDTPQAL